MSEPTIKVSLTARQVATLHAAMITLSEGAQSDREAHLVNIKTIREIMPRRNHGTLTADGFMRIDDDKNYT